MDEYCSECYERLPLNKKMIIDYEKVKFFGVKK